MLHTPFPPKPVLKQLILIAGFTGIDDPYEQPLNCEVCIC